MYSRKTQSPGLTLVELLVAMVISLVVLGGVYQIFRETTRTYRIQEGLSRVQENGRFAMDFMMRDIRHAELGLAGIRGFDAQGGGWVPSILPDADIIRTLPRRPPTVRESDIIRVRGERIGSSVATTFYLVAMNPREQPALHRRIGEAEHPEEVVTGVETMQFLYGVGDRYVASYLRADEVNAGNNWGNVRSVQIGLLLRTPDEIRGMEPNNTVYDVLGTTFGPFNDRHLRRVFVATVALRNRLP